MGNSHLITMMKNSIFLLGILFSLEAVASAAACNSGQMNIKINMIKAVKGQILVAVHVSSETYLKKKQEPFLSTSVAVSSTGTQQLHLCDVPEGDYAIAVFHDENSNGELDTGFLGIPKEPYGFSNNPKSLRPPSFEEATLHFESNSLVEINLK